MAETSFLWRDIAMRIRERFNPRAPCGARHISHRPPKHNGKFQPTRPLRGATRYQQQDQRARQYFNPRAPCGARPNAGNWTITDEGFQPTRPLRGATGLGPGPSSSRRFQPTRPLRGATRGCKSCSSQVRFQPTRPLRGATKTEVPSDFSSNISTHAPLAGRD